MSAETCSSVSDACEVNRRVSTLLRSTGLTRSRTGRFDHGTRSATCRKHTDDFYCCDFGVELRPLDRTGMKGSSGEWRSVSGGQVHTMLVCQRRRCRQRCRHNLDTSYHKNTSYNKNTSYHKNTLYHKNMARLQNAAAYVEHCFTRARRRIVVLFYLFF